MIAVRHCGIVVSNMEKSLHFYRDLLGLKESRVMNESGEFIDSILGLENVQVTTVKLSGDDGPTLVELLEFKSHQDEDPARRTLYSIGPTHAAFTVDNLDEVYCRLSEAGIRFTTPPQLSPDGYAKVTFCQDPDGTRIELVEVLEIAN